MQGVGAMLCAGIAWAVMPDLGFRWLLALTAVPAVAILCCCWFVPESPYWLHVKGRWGKWRRRGWARRGESDFAVLWSYGVMWIPQAFQ